MINLRVSWKVGLVLVLTGCASTPPAGNGLPNFCRVDSHLYRGGQPSTNGFDELKKEKVGTIIDLRMPSEGSHSREEEKAAVAKAQLQYISEPMSGLGAPSREAVERVLAVIGDPERKEPVFLHCRRGADRTGTLVAIYRITHDCWTADRAIEEAREHGMSWLEFGMRRLIRDWYQDVLRCGCCRVPAGEKQ